MFNKKPLTVNGELGTFTDKIDNLKEISKTSSHQADVIDGEIAEMLKKRDDLRHEAARADHVAEKLQALVDDLTGDGFVEDAAPNDNVIGITERTAKAVGGK